MPNGDPKWQWMCLDELTTDKLEGKTMVSDVESVRVTHDDYATRKKHMLLGAGLVLLLLVIGLAFWLTSRNTGLFPVKVNGKYGYINKSGQMAIQPQFDRAEPFYEGYAPVQPHSQRGDIATT